MTASTSIALNALPTLDVESKVVLPSKALYHALQNGFAALYQAAREDLIALHGDFAQATLQLYHHPLETFGGWRDSAVYLAKKVQTEVNESVLPQLDASYRHSAAVLDGSLQQMLSGINRAGMETRDFFGAFYAHPQETSAHVYARLMSGIQSVSGETVDMYRRAVAQASADVDTALAAMQQLYHTTLAVSAELLDEPTATAAALYYKLSAAMLDFYAQGVGVMLELLQQAQMSSGWAL